MSNAPIINYYARNAFDGVMIGHPAAHTTPARRIVKPSKAVAALTLVAYITLMTAGVALGSVGRTMAFFYDSETSATNIFGAGSLDFTAAQTPQSIDIIPNGTPVTIPASVTAANGSATTSVRVTMVQTGGEPALCAALVATTPAPFVYSGPLTALTGVMPAGTAITIALTLPAPVPDTPDHAQCMFDLVFKGWNAAVPENTGYTDEERIAVTVTDPPPPDTPAAVVVTEEPQSTTTPPDAVIPPDPTPTDTPPVVVDTPVTPPDPVVPPADTPPAPATE